MSKRMILFEETIFIIYIMVMKIKSKICMKSKIC